MEIRLLSPEDMDAACEVIGLAFADNPHTLAVVRGDRSRGARMMRAAPGILFIEGDDPAGFVDAVGQEAIIIRLRASGNGAVMWCVFDSARVAATTALWIAESLWFPFS